MPFAKVNYKQIYYKDWPAKDGTPTRPTIIMSHGLGSSNNYYTAVIPFLTAQGHRCISFDMTGSALSPYTYIEQSIHTLAKDVVDLMDALSIPKAIFAGHSMSGIVGPEVAAEWPDRIQGLILIGPVWPTAEVAPVFEDRIDKVAKNGMEVMADTVPYAAVGSKASSLHHAFIRELLLGMEPAGYISLCRVIASAYKQPPKYAKVGCPTLVIAGEEDKSAPLAGCEKIVDAIGAEKKDLVVMSKCGHWHCIEDPNEVGKLCLDFLTKVF